MGRVAAMALAAPMALVAAEPAGLARRVESPPTAPGRLMEAGMPAGWVLPLSPQRSRSARSRR
jgi:hypothetical protein